jgi:hypothetical protein
VSAYLALERLVDGKLLARRALSCFKKAKGGAGGASRMEEEGWAGGGVGGKERAGREGEGEREERQASGGMVGTLTWIAMYGTTLIMAGLRPW